MNRKGQMGMGLIWGIIGLVVTILVFIAFLPTIREQFDSTRNYDVFNCETTNTAAICPNVSGSGGGYCYNATYAESDDVSCVFVGIATPLIVIFVILGAIGAMMVAKAYTPPQPEYYEGY